MTPLLDAYRSLLRELGPQGWWPVRGRYHPGDYSYPRTVAQQWEVCAGAVLTQNTAWTSAERALVSLRDAGRLDDGSLLDMRTDRLASLVRPSGFYNQKAARLKALAAAAQRGGGVARFLEIVSREQLLSVHGIGQETADSILLYAAKRPFFVVDAYTRRLFGGRFFRTNAPYEEIRRLFETSLPRDREIYNEFHALIVAKGKMLRSAAASRLRG